MSLITFTSEESPKLFTSAKREYESRMMKSVSNSEFLKIMIQSVLGEEAELTPQEESQYRLLECESQINDLYDKCDRLMSMITGLYK